VNNHCVLTTSDSGRLDVVDFSTEKLYDLLTINGVEYSGTEGPFGLSIAAGETITFDSDDSVVSTGFEVFSSRSCRFLIHVPSNNSLPLALLSYHIYNVLLFIPRPSPLRPPSPPYRSATINWLMEGGFMFLEAMFLL